MAHIKALKIYFLDSMNIGALFEDGSFRKYDLKRIIPEIPVFERLKDSAFFRSARLSPGGYGIIWDDELDIDVSEIYYNGTEWPDAPLKDISPAMIIRQFRQIRMAAGKSQQELAEATGLKQANIARLENGGCVPRLDTLMQLGKALGYTLRWEKEA